MTEHHDHHHGQGHAAHSHAHGADARAVGLAALLTGGFMLAEFVGGLLAGSLALLADAGHMATDFAALALAWFAFRLARRPADWKRTYGFDRFSVLAAFVNGLALFALAIWIVVEAVHRLNQPVEVLGGPMLVIAVLGLAVNIGSFLVLHRSGGDSLNVRAATLHVLGDLLGSVGAIVAAGVILATGWYPIDPILSVLVSILILRSGWFVVRDSARILLEAAPEGFDTREARETLRVTIPEVISIHHMHAWSITEARRMVTLEANVAEGADVEAVRTRIKKVLTDRYGIGHATVEVRRVPQGSHASTGV